MTGAMVNFGDGERFSGYLAAPSAKAAPTVLVLHAWWGLNDFFKSLCDRLAGAGYIAFAPDLFNGRVASTVDEAMSMEEERGSRYVEEAALEAVRFTHSLLGVRPIGIAVVGFSFGAAWANLLSTLRPKTVRAVVLFYGAYAPDFSRAAAAYLGHFAEVDAWEPREGVEEMRVALEAAGRPVTLHFYEGTGHWFFESDRPDAYKAEAAHLAWDRTLAFLAEQLPDMDEPLPRDMAELLARIEAGWSRFSSAVAGLGADKLERPGPDGWSAREQIAHVAFWERLMLLSYLRGQPAAEVAQMDAATLADLDAINAIVAERTRGRSLDAVLTESRAIHAEVVAELASRRFEELMQPRFPVDEDDRPRMLWIAGNTYAHYAEHVGALHSLLGAHG